MRKCTMHCKFCGFESQARTKAVSHTYARQITHKHRVKYKQYNNTLNNQGDGGE